VYVLIGEILGCRLQSGPKRQRHNRWTV